MAGLKRGRWWVTAGVLLGLPSLFWFTFGPMQNVYGALLLLIGLLPLRKGNKWSKCSFALTCAMLAGLLVAFNEFLQGVYGLWSFGILATLVYAALILSMRTALLSSAQQRPARLLKYSFISILATHMLFIISHTWFPVGALGLLPMAAQLYMLVSLWACGRTGTQPAAEG